MALTVRDILELPSGQKFQTLAGRGGLSRPVISVEIADYEFAPDIEMVADDDFDLDLSMEANSFIITSFLFAKDDPSLILSSVEKMVAMGMSGLAFKEIIYRELPSEVLEFADRNNFPIFSFGRKVWFENIIFDIMYAVQFDDKVYLSEEKIDAMLSGTIEDSELETIRKGISLRLQDYVSVIYIANGSIDSDRILRSFYMLKGFHNKGLMVPYRDSLFLLLTSGKSDAASHELIRREAFELLGLGTSSKSGAAPAPSYGMSDVHKHTEISRAFRESWFCHMASRAEVGQIGTRSDSIHSDNRPFNNYGEIGLYQVLLPALDNIEIEEYADRLVGGFADNKDLMETAARYVATGGDIVTTAARLHCHQNTVRYRLGRIRELTGLQSATDGELYMQLKTALAIIHAKAVSV